MDNHPNDRTTYILHYDTGSFKGTTAFDTPEEVKVELKNLLGAMKLQNWQVSRVVTTDATEEFS